jgi:hypothetical protein
MRNPCQRKNSQPPSKNRNPVLKNPNLNGKLLRQKKEPAVDLAHVIEDDALKIEVHVETDTVRTKNVPVGATDQDHAAHRNLPDQDLEVTVASDVIERRQRSQKNAVPRKKASQGTRDVVQRRKKRKNLKRRSRARR